MLAGNSLRIGVAGTPAPSMEEIDVLALSTSISHYIIPHNAHTTAIITHMPLEYRPSI